MDHAPLAAAEAFHAPGAVLRVSPLGSGNVNDTFLVETQSGSVVLQRLNTAVFPCPEQVMRNLQTVEAHIQRKEASPGDSRWEHPRLVTPADGRDEPWYCCAEGGVWRCMSFIENARSVDRIEDAEQAYQLGLGLGRFHHLISDLPPGELHDTLEGFHITPHYLDQYRQALVRTEVQPSAETSDCIAFIRDRESFCSVLEQAKARGELQERPIHGDPKINNVMLDRVTGEAVALIDLDTVKPGLVHYDIGDCLRSCCNRAGEEATDLRGVQFDLKLAEAILRGYLEAAGSMLTATDLRFIPESARLISFELGLRFFTDHLNGDRYFKVSEAGQNLRRAQVQFALTQSIEEQWEPLQALVHRLTTSVQAA